MDLVEGVDYYFDGGLMVFTAAFHLKRGYCCASHCRHCPYGLAPAGRKETPRAVSEKPVNRYGRLTPPCEGKEAP